VLGWLAGEHYRNPAPRLPRLEVHLVPQAPAALSLEPAARPIEQPGGFYRLPKPAAPSPDASARNTPAAEAIYYPARELDVRATPLSDIQLTSPDLTGRERGTVVLRLYINAQGGVDNVVIARAEPPRVFGPTLLQPFRAARFAPARKGGVAVASLLLVEIEYGEAAPDR
jgi:protein TonB